MAIPDTYAEQTKLCAGPCGRTLPISAFYVRRADNDLQGYCKECSRDAVNDWREMIRRQREQREQQVDYGRTLAIRPVDLVCQSDIAQRLGESRHVVHYWVRNDPQFPLPVVRVGDKRGIPIWDYREVEAYVTTKRRQQ